MRKLSGKSVTPLYLKSSVNEVRGRSMTSGQLRSQNLVKNLERMERKNNFYKSFSQRTTTTISEIIIKEMRCFVLFFSFRHRNSSLQDELRVSMTSALVLNMFDQLFPVDRRLEFSYLAHLD